MADKKDDDLRSVWEAWQEAKSKQQFSDNRHKIAQGPPTEDAIIKQNKQLIEDIVPVAQEEDTDDILEFEVKRRSWLFKFIGFVWIVAATFYFLLVIWVFFCSDTPYAWHTTLALAITPTTLTLVTLKLLAKPENGKDTEDPNSNTATLDLVNKLMSIIDKRSSQ